MELLCRGCGGGGGGGGGGGSATAVSILGGPRVVPVGSVRSVVVCPFIQGAVAAPRPAPVDGGQRCFPEAGSCQ
jgi:hypothetical protein